MHKQLFAFAFAALIAVLPVRGAGKYFEVTYPPSTKEGELSLGVTYTLWLPEGVQKVRGVIVHQHGCGEGACKGGATAAYDLHWQALAKKWDHALLGPSYHQSEKDNCRLWSDPRNGSHKTFLRSLDEFATKAERPELAKAPWCLWGHSCGGFWASLMQTMYPERIVAIWFRSGTAFATWEKGEIPKPKIPHEAYGIPMMLNPGAKEKGDKCFDGAGTGSFDMFRAYGAKGAPVGYAQDPRTAHECGDSRYLAIPFFDACLAIRLPVNNNQLGQGLLSRRWNDGTVRLRPVETRDYRDDQTITYRKGFEVLLEFVWPEKEAEYLPSWVPNGAFLKLWDEYTKTGATNDTTPPSAPFNLRVAAKPEGAELTWDAEADFESGLAGFVIERDGQELAKLPEKSVGRFGRALFQTMSYHDTPEKPKDGSLPEMRFVDTTAKAGVKHIYRIIAINSVGLRSSPASAK